LTSDLIPRRNVRINHEVQLKAKLFFMLLENRGRDRKFET